MKRYDIQPMRYLIAILLLAPISAGADIIIEDNGGNIGDRMVQVLTDKRSGRGHIIRGICASACTLNLYTSCVEPGAELYFHGPQPPRGEKLSAEDFEFFSQLMAAYYPPKIAKWFISDGRHGEFVMSGATAIRLGARACPQL